MAPSGSRVDSAVGSAGPLKLGSAYYTSLPWTGKASVCSSYAQALLSQKVDLGSGGVFLVDILPSPPLPALGKAPMSPKPSSLV